MEDFLGDRIKSYEKMEAGRKLLPLLPIVARMDGRSFSRFTKGLKRPYDERLSQLMVETTRFLVQETNARIGYTQSDEISLVLYSDNVDSQVYFDGKIHKMVSQLAAQTTAVFNHLLPKFLPEKAELRQVGNLPTFDARIFVVPSLTEAANAILWREQDATKNSISMAARAHFSHKELQDKSGKEMQEMLFSVGVNWNDFPAFFKRGSYVQRVTVINKFTTEELESLPSKHAARLNPALEFERVEIKLLELPPLGSIVNRERVLFFGHPPLLVVKMV
jgi:tRNA(His) 5'-end guanylyltransferase